MSTMVAIPSTIEDQPETLPQPEVRTEVTPEELLAMPDGGHYELVDGELRERKASALSNVIVSRIDRRLGNHCEDNNLGWLFAADHGYQCFPWKPGLVRRADLSFIRLERYPLERLYAEGFTTIPPDLAVEVVSPNDLASAVDVKVAEYLRAGVKLVWVIRPAVRAVQVFRADRSESWLWGDDAELTGEDVIPGFRCRVADLFPGPPVGEAVAPEQAAAGPEAP
jgi:Uma2 family endonuclease